MPTLTVFVIAAVYLIALGLVRLIQTREFRRHPEKGRRYASLPATLKFACPLVVVPAFTIAPMVLLVLGMWDLAAVCGFLIGPVLLLVVETAAVRWYRRHGLL